MKTELRRQRAPTLPVDNTSPCFNASLRNNAACCGHALGTTLHTFQKPRDSQTTESDEHKIQQFTAPSHCVHSRLLATAQGTDPKKCDPRQLGRSVPWAGAKKRGKTQRAPDLKSRDKNAIRPRFCLCNRPRGVTVSTVESESSDRGSNPREVSRQIF